MLIKSNSAVFASSTKRYFGFELSLKQRIKLLFSKRIVVLNCNDNCSIETDKLIGYYINSGR